MLLFVTLNVSNPHNIHADSGYIFTKTILEGVLDARPQWNALVAAPTGALFDHPRVRTVCVPRIGTKYEARFAFDWQKLATAIKDRRGPIDLVWANQAETTPSVLALLRCLEGREVPSFTYFHYPAVARTDDASDIRLDPSLNDWGLGRAIVLRQYEAFVCSTVSAVASVFARDLLLSGFRSFALPLGDADLVVLPPPIDIEPSADVGAFENSPATILYNHRLYAHYGTSRLLDWMEAFAEKSRRSFRLLVTDPLDNRSPEQNRLDDSVLNFRQRIASLPYAVLVAPKSRQEYFEHVKSATVGLAPFREAPPWSMSCTDIMACGRPLLVPRSGPFGEMLGDRPSLMFRERDEFVAKLTSLVTSEDHWRTEATYCLARSGTYARRVIAERFAMLFERAMGMGAKGVGC